MTEAGAIRVVLADDHPVVRHGLAAMLRSVEGMDVVGEAADGAQAIRAAVTLAPDVLVMDIHMPNSESPTAPKQPSSAATPDSVDGIRKTARPRVSRQPTTGGDMAGSSGAEFHVPRSVTLQVGAAAALSWLGLYVHNVAGLPGQTVLSPESAGPAVFTLLLVAFWVARARRPAALLLLGWAWLNLAGGAVLSVLPLPFLPFVPEQSLWHYAFHALYGALQLPLILILTVGPG